MLTMAVTGGIACGKSTVGLALEARGVPVRDADTVAHELMHADAGLRRLLRQDFGARAIRPDGPIDRQELARIVFADPAARARLNALVHPRVRLELVEWQRDMARRKQPACAALVPLLFEAGMASDWDVVICVAAAPAVQEARLRERGLTIADARRRIAAHMPLAEKMERSDFVILNNGGKHVVEGYVGRILNRILEARHGRNTI